MTDHDHPDTDLNDPHGEAEALRKENERLREALAIARNAQIARGDVFADADTEARWIEDSKNACPACGGSGHKDDAAPASPDWTASARDMLATWDAWMDCGASDRRADTDRLVRAAIFAAQAYDDAMASIAPDSAAGYMLRTFLVALIDWKDPQLDPLRAKNRVAASRAPDSVVNAGSSQLDDVAPWRMAFENAARMAEQGILSMDGGQAAVEIRALAPRIPAAPVAEAQPTIGGAELDALVARLRAATFTKGRSKGGVIGQTIDAAMRNTFHEVSAFDLDEAADAITALRAQQDWKAMAERLGEALTYYADPKNYAPDKRYANQPWPIFDDEGDVAIAALSDLAKMKGE